MESGAAGQRRHTLEPMNVVTPDIRTGDFTGAVYAKKEPRYGHHIARGAGQKCRIGEKVMIKVGDKVTWESQAQGSWVRKTGKVIAVVPPGESALGWVPLGTKKSHIKFEVDVYLRGDRAVVAVPAGAYDELINYYAPRLSVLEISSTPENAPKGGMW